jgi:hypothetical protein
MLDDYINVKALGSKLGSSEDGKSELYFFAQRVLVLNKPEPFLSHKNCFYLSFIRKKFMLCK